MEIPFSIPNQTNKSIPVDLSFSLSSMSVVKNDNSDYELVSEITSRGSGFGYIIIFDPEESV